MKIYENKLPETEIEQHFAESVSLPFPHVRNYGLSSKNTIELHKI